MSQELFYTSSPRGLDVGSSGFCVVAATRGISPRVREKLQGLSSYRHLFPPLDPRNPVVYTHLRLNIGGKPYHVVSRIGDAPLDYTGRSNYLAHHVVLEENELPRGGPAWLMSQAGYLASGWKGDPRPLEPARPPQGDVSLARCVNWERVTGDAGWAGVLAEEFENDPNRPVLLLVKPGVDLLPLINEAIALLPSERRWEVSFSTHFLSVPPGTTCIWRGSIRTGTEEEPAALPGGLVLDLTAPMGTAREGSLVEAARTGRPRRGPAPQRQQAAPPRSSTAPSPPSPGDAPRPAAERRKETPAAPKPTASTGHPWAWGLGVGLVTGIVLALIGAMVFYYVGGPNSNRLQAADENKNLTEELKTANEKIADLESNVKKRDDRINTLEGERKIDQGKIATLTTERDTARAGIGTKEKELLVQLNMAKMKATADLKKAHAERDEAKNRASSLLSVVQSIKESFQPRGLVALLEKAETELKPVNTVEMRNQLLSWVDHESEAMFEVKNRGLDKFEVNTRNQLARYLDAKKNPKVTQEQTDRIQLDAMKFCEGAIKECEKFLNDPMRDRPPLTASRVKKTLEVLNDLKKQILDRKK